MSTLGYICFGGRLRLLKKGRSSHPGKHRLGVWSYVGFSQPLGSQEDIFQLSRKKLRLVSSTRRFCKQKRSFVCEWYRIADPEFKVGPVQYRREGAKRSMKEKHRNTCIGRRAGAVSGSGDDLVSMETYRQAVNFERTSRSSPARALHFLRLIYMRADLIRNLFFSVKNGPKRLPLSASGEKVEWQKG